MIRHLSILAVSLLAVCLVSGLPREFAPVVVSQANTPPDTPPAKVAAAEKSALAKASKAATRYALWCAKNGAYEEARQFYRLAGYMSGNPVPARNELNKLSGKQDEFDKGYESKRDDQRSKLLKGGEALLEVALDARKANAEGWGRECAALWLLFFRDDEMLEKAGWQWYGPLSFIVPKADIEQFEAGALRHNGEWVEADALKKANESRASFDSPWEVHDGVHLVRTTQGLSIAQRTLGHATLFRTWFMARYATELDLRLPKGFLPILLASTIDEFIQLRAGIFRSWGHEPPPDRGRGEGIYLGNTTHSNCSVLMSAQGANPDGTRHPLAIDGLNRTAQHEITHQLLYEGRKWNAKPDSEAAIQTLEWVAEGIATVSEMLELADGAWTAHIRRTWTLFQSESVGRNTRFATAVRSKDKFPPLSEFTVQGKAEWDKEPLQNYAQACVLCYCLLYKCDSATAEKYMRVLIEFHDLSCRPDSFSKQFKPAEMEALQALFSQFLENIEFEG
jgi:hypothetical protein